MAKPADILRAARAGSARWKEAFNAGDAAACAACYEPDATMTASPFGTFTGRAEICAFWEKLIADGFAAVEYRDEKWTCVEGEQRGKAVRMAAGWSMNKAKGVITEEMWVLQPDGEALLRVDRFEVAQ